MLSFITSFYRFINPPPEQPFPIEYNAQWHEIETLKYFDQVGKSLLRKQFKKINARKQIVICFTNRCGSNWLAELLYATGLMGLADEFFNTERIKESCDTNQLDSFDDFVRHLPNNHSTVNKVFATKLSWDQLYFLSRLKVIPNIIPRPQFIYIVRNDVAAQALSLLVAQQTGQWKSNWNSGINGKVNFETLGDEQIIEVIAEIQFAQSQFELYFDTLGLKPYRVCYEDLQKEPELIIEEIIRYLKISTPKAWRIHPANLQLEKQRDAQSEKRLAQFHHNTNHRYVFSSHRSIG